MSDVFSRLVSAGRLPSPSGVGARILSLTQGDEATIDDIASVLAQDPALTGRILRVANSTSLSGTVSLTTTRDAAMRLGLRSVSSIAVSFTLISANREGSCEEFDYAAYWSRSMAAAVAAQSLCKLVAPGLAPSAFTAGLLLEIGRLGLASSEPAVYSGLVRASRGDRAQELELERRNLGIDHAELAARMVADWGMPNMIHEAIEVAAAAGPLDTSSLGTDATLMAELLSCAARLASRHIGMAATDWQEDEALLEALERLDLAPSELAKELPLIEEQWRELAQDLALKPLPPWNAGEEEAGDLDEPEPGGPLILAVDSDPIALKMLTNCLHRAGHRVAPAHSAEEALALALQHEPTILITARQLPGLSGEALCRALRQCDVGRRLFMVLLMQRDEEAACREALQTQVDDFLARPFHPRELLARVEFGLNMAAARVPDLPRPEVVRPPEQHDRAYATGRLTVAFEDASQPISVVTLAIDGLQFVKSPLLRKDLTKQIETCLRPMVRKSDVLANTADGSFLLLCHGAALVDAMEVAERMRQAVHTSRIGIAGQVRPVTISLGVAERSDNMRGPAALMILARTALELGAMQAPDQVYCAA